MDERVIRLICLQMKCLQNKRPLFSLRRKKTKKHSRLFSQICIQCCKKWRRMRLSFNFHKSHAWRIWGTLQENKKTANHKKKILDCIFRSHLKSGKTYTSFIVRRRFALCFFTEKKNIWHITLELWNLIASSCENINEQRERYHSTAFLEKKNMVWDHAWATTTLA